jgi:predicted DNA-binding ribbon-helix-helix protein
MAKSRLVTRNVVSGRGRTSVRLEPELWDALHEIRQRERIGLDTLIRHIEQVRLAGSRTSALRIFIFNYFREAATEEGHCAAGHGTSVSLRDRV